MCYSKGMLIGGHVSIAGGFDKSIDRAHAIGANCLQTFASSPRSLTTTTFLPEILDLYRQKKAALKMGPHFFHGVYLVNLAHESQAYVEASVASLIFYQQLAGTIGGEGTIFHLGSHKGKGFDAVFDQIVLALTAVLKKTPDGVHLFLENAAGQSGAIGDDLTQLRKLYDAIPSSELRSKLFICFDTQHAFSAGYDLRSSQMIDDTCRRIDTELGLSLIKVIHANDSKVDFDGHKDRHENIGDGFIGKVGMRAIARCSAFSSLPFLLEVPGKDKNGPQLEDVRLFRALMH